MYRNKAPNKKLKKILKERRVVVAIEVVGQLLRECDFGGLFYKSDDEILPRHFYLLRRWYSRIEVNDHAQP